MGREKQKIANIIYFMTGPIAASIIGLITTPVITFFISPEEFAKANLFQMFQTIISTFVYLGFDQSYVRFFHEKKYKDKVFENSFLLPMLLAVLGAITILLVKNDFASYLFSDSNEILPICIMAISIPLLVLERFLLLNLRMQEKGAAYSSLTLLLKIVILVVTTGLLVFGRRDYKAVIYGSVCGEILYDAILIMYCRKTIKEITWKKIDIKVVKAFAVYSLPLAPIDLISKLLNSTDRIFIKKYLTMTDVGIYATALRVTGLIAIVKSSITSFWVPISFRWSAEGGHEKDYNKVMEIVSAIMIAGCCLGLLIKRYIFLLFGREYREAQYIFPYLMFYPVLYTITETFSIGITIKKKGYIITLISLVSLIVNIGMNIFCVPRFGAVGAAFATAFSNLLYFFSIMIFSRKLWFKFPVKKIIISVLVLCITTTFNVVIKNKLIYLVNVLSIVSIIIIYRNITEDLIVFCKKYLIKK